MVTWVNSHLFRIMESLRWEKAPKIIKSSLQPSTPEPVLEFQQWGPLSSSVVGHHFASPQHGSGGSKQDSAAGAPGEEKPSSVQLVSA